MYNSHTFHLMNNSFIIKKFILCILSSTLTVHMFKIKYNTLVIYISNFKILGQLILQI